jgi:hypothetical protein
MKTRKTLQDMTGQIFQIQISLQGSKPKIWRRILVKPEITLVDFHKIIQTVMGWTNSHLHLFQQGRNSYSPEEFEVEDTKNSRKVTLNSLLKKEKDKIKYEYDFGDGWQHDILLEKILPSDKTMPIPSCIDGKGNCPPEDCGGIWGYEEIKKILVNSKHEQYEETMEWLGGEFDPDYFDKNKINEILKNPDYGCVWVE